MHYVDDPGAEQERVGRGHGRPGTLGADGFNVAGVQGNPVNTVTGTYPAGGTQALFGAPVTIVTR